ncbi:AbrB/MazE/SpoVT family DNA-binding domain-containing protein [Rhizorhapis sp. SPR117]|uniref:AbrB/MazE/SpoVT family DNA-binding domain-containing protein n=1 Tax=Rhizorhapis sp. SPR117 TaxID=2912611 RepID=UPI001F3241F2|nr:AbrB/MazE/SpoVT family DNA-binding domain-containing protein [Rhizorhapis sp. SPR117]
MSVHSVKITADGRIQIPAQLRREMNLRAGETLNLELHDGTLSVHRPSKALERIRARFAKYVEPGSDVVAELKAQRVEDAQRG